MQTNVRESFGAGDGVRGMNFCFMSFCFIITAQCITKGDLFSKSKSGTIRQRGRLLLPKVLHIKWLLSGLYYINKLPNWRRPFVGRLDPFLRGKMWLVLKRLKIYSGAAGRAGGGGGGGGGGPCVAANQQVDLGKPLNLWTSVSLCEMIGLNEMG